MIMAAGQIVAKTDRSQTTEGSAQNETDYNSLKKSNLGLYILLNWNLYQTVCLGRGLRSPSASSFSMCSSSTAVC